MTLPASGAISLNDVNVELSLSGTASINMGSAAVRGLFGVASGAISMSNGHGKSSVSYTLTRSTSSVNEGATQTITLTTSGVANGNIPYTITGITAADLNTGSLSGNFAIVNGAATLSFTFVNDFSKEGTESAVLSLTNGAASISWNVNDTSIPTFALSRSASTVGSAGNFTISVNTQGVPDGTTVPYTISGITSGFVTAGALSGTITINNNTGSISITLDTFTGLISYMRSNTAYLAKANEDLSSVGGAVLYSRNFTTNATYNAGWWRDTGATFTLFDSSTSFDPDGRLEQWTAANPFDLDGATLTATRNYSFTPSNPNIQAMQYSPNGSYFFEINRSSDSVSSRSVSAPYYSLSGISSTSYPKTNVLTNNLAGSLFVHPSGTKFWVGGYDSYTGSTAWTILEYTMSTTFRASTASLTTGFSLQAHNASFSVPKTIWFNYAGTKLYVMDEAGRMMYFTLGTAYDVTTRSYVRTVNTPTYSAITHHSMRWINTINRSIVCTLGATASGSLTTGSPSISVTYSASV